MTDAARSVGATSSPADEERRLILLLIGAVGAGKGTQARILADRLGLTHLASGELFRAALAAGTPLGEQARRYMEKGELVPDDITTGMVMMELGDRSSGKRGAILDGFPRTVGQADALDRTLAEQRERVERAIYIDVPTEELIRRVSGRWICPTCGTPYHTETDPPRLAGVCDRDGVALTQRDDDRPEVVRARMEKQVPPMLDVVDHYERAGILERVDGRQPIEAVTSTILDALGTPRGAPA